MDTRRDDGNADSDDNRCKIDVSEDCHLGKGRWDGENKEDDGGDGGEDNGADMAAVEVDQGNATGQGVRTDYHDQFQNEGGTKDFITDATEKKAAGVRIGRDLRVLQFDLTDEVACENGNATEGDGEENAREHAEGCVCLRQAEGAECDSFDNGNDGQAFPAQAVEVGIAIGSNLLDALRIGDFAEDVVFGHLIGIGVVFLVVFLQLLGA